MSRTKKPCPGCGEINIHRKADEVCRDCKELLKNADKWRKQLSKVARDEIVVVYSAQSHWHQYLHTRTDDHNDSSNLMRAFHRLAIAATIREAIDKKEEYEIIGHVEEFNPKRSVMPRELGDAIHKLYLLMQPLLDATYSKGKSDGHNLLMRLAEGDLSPNDFIKKT